VLRDMQGLQERIKLLQEELAASVQEANSRSLFVLTVVTVLALPMHPYLTEEQAEEVAVALLTALTK
ncbi:MAG: hypothetical protein RRY64_10210, partial [Oscillospiraceae bacterium]